MTDTFRQHLANNGFGPAEIADTLNTAETITIASHTPLIEQDADANSLYFVVRGICHGAYLTDDGKQYSKEFYWEGDWIIGFESLIRQQPLPFLIESIESCQLVRLPIRWLTQLRRQCHPFYLNLVETQLCHKENKERFMLLNTPESRYRRFCQDYPRLLIRLSDYQIAAYLGITPISLSRIKKRLSS